MFRATMYVLGGLFRPNRTPNELAEMLCRRMEGEKVSPTAREQLASLQKQVFEEWKKKQP